MLIGGDDICNDIITLDTCFSMFVYIVLIDWWKYDSSVDEEPATGELEVEFKFQRCSCKLFFFYSPCCQNAPGSLLAGYLGSGYTFRA